LEDSIANFGLQDRMRFAAGDFFTDPLAGRVSARS
jgi:hypothetical protein